MILPYVQMRVLLLNCHLFYLTQFECLLTFCLGLFGLDPVKDAYQFSIEVYVDKFVVLIWLINQNQYISREKLTLSNSMSFPTTIELGCSTTQCLIYVHIYWAFECLNICRLLIWIKWKSVFMMLICIYYLGWCLPLFHGCL